MKLMRCRFDFDNGACHEKKTCFIFSKTGERRDVVLWLQSEFFDGNDCEIQNLKINEVKPYDGLVI